MKDLFESDQFNHELASRWGEPWGQLRISQHKLRRTQRAGCDSYLQLDRVNPGGAAVRWFTEAGCPSGLSSGNTGQGEPSGCSTRREARWNVYLHQSSCSLLTRCNNSHLNFRISGPKSLWRTNIMIIIVTVLVTVTSSSSSDHRSFMSLVTRGTSESLGISARPESREQPETQWAPGPAHNPPDRSPVTASRVWGVFTVPDWDDWFSGTGPPSAAWLPCFHNQGGKTTTNMLWLTRTFSVTNTHSRLGEIIQVKVRNQDNLVDSHWVWHQRSQGYKY